MRKIRIFIFHLFKASLAPYENADFPDFRKMKMRIIRIFWLPEAVDTPDSIISIRGARTSPTASPHPPKMPFLFPAAAAAAAAHFSMASLTSTSTSAAASVSPPPSIVQASTASKSPTGESASSPGSNSSLASGGSNGSPVKGANILTPSPLFHPTLAQHNIQRHLLTLR